jgi:hypothetical protein
MLLEDLAHARPSHRLEELVADLELQQIIVTSTLHWLPL